MRLSVPPGHAAALVLVLAAVAVPYACSEAPVAPQPPNDQLLGKRGGGGPKVDKVDPPSAPQDTTLDIIVVGSGYDETSEVTLLLDRKPTADITTNSTTFVDTESVIANVTITDEAAADLYDVEVTAQRGRKKGVGVEAFEVTSKGEVPVSAVVETFTSQTAPGLYSLGWTDFTTATVDLNTRVDVQCSSVDPSARFVLVPNLGPDSSPLWGDYDASDCDGGGARAQLMIPGVLALVDGGPVGEQSIQVEPGMSLGPYLNYFFLVDTSRKGRTKFRLPWDEQYNYVWTNATATATDQDNDGRIDVWHITASEADLISETKVAGRALPFALDVTLTRQ